MQLINRPYRVMTTAALLLVGLVVTLTVTLLIHQTTYAHVAAEEVAAPVAAVTTVIYVDHAAPGPTHDGTSWNNAYLTLQDALAAATTGSEIWVAAGIYYPDEGGSATNNDPNASFALQNGVAIYGGFAAVEAVREDRNWMQQITVLSGDLEQNDTSVDSDGINTNPSSTTLVGDNAYQVVTALNVDNTAVLDGFVITSGKATGTFSGACSVACGAGINLDTSTPLLQNLTIAGNYAGSYGAAITALDATVYLEDSIIHANRSENSGGAVYLRRSGGALTDVVLSGNRSSNQGGGLYTFQVTDPLTLTNITINGNRALHRGGGIYNVQSTLLLKNAIVWNNSANFGLEISNDSGATTTIADSTIKNAFLSGVWDSELGIDGGNNLDSDPLFVTEISPTSAPTNAGDHRLQALSPAADAGDDSANSSAGDVAGAGRIKGAAIDMGAHESSHVAQISVAKAVTPATIEYGESITYTIVLNNSGDAYAYSTSLTDTLPADVSFDSWLQQPAGADYQGGSHTITWTGTITAADSRTFEFMAIHTGGPDETITNTVAYGHATGDDTAEEPFTVLPLPTVDIADATVDEAAGSATITVSLSATTRKPVVLTYATGDDVAVAGDDYTDTTGTLTITPGSLTGFIAIPVNSDFIDEEDEPFTVTLTNATDGTLGDATADVTILDDDTAGTNVSPQILSVDEPNSTETFTITFDSQPVKDVVVTLSNSDTSECFVPNSVTVNSTNWQQGVPVDVQAVDDFVVDGDQQCLLQMSAASDDPKYNNIGLDSVNVTVHSDDVAGIGISPSSFSIGEAGEVGHFTVTLTSEPTATVTIDLSRDDDTECSVPAQITLDAGNWSDGVAVPVTAQDDDFDDDNQLCTIQSTVTSPDSNYDGRAMSNVPVTVVDDDTAGVAISSTTITTSEPGGEVTFAAKLTSKPLASVTIHFESKDTSECTVPPSITLDGDNWNVDVSVLVSAVDDRIDDGDQSCVVETTVSSSDPKYQDVPTDDVDVTVQDDSDEAGVILSKTAFSVTEPSTTNSFVVTLNSEPVNPVTIRFSSHDATECIVTASVVLNSSNWETGQTATVTAVDDNNIDGPQSCLIQADAIATDAVYDGIAVADPVVTVEDEDVANVIVGSPNVTVREPNNSTIMILKLTSIPTSSVTVALTSGDPTECAVPSSVTINASNWDSGVGATVFAVNDDIDDGDRTCNVQGTITSNDIHYHNLAVEDFQVTVEDDDTAGTTVTPATLTVSEPDTSAIFTVALTSEPTATVTVDLVSGDSSECTVPISTTLNAGNWRNGVSVTVTAADDFVDDETQLCTVGTSTTSSDQNYQAIAIEDVAVNVADDDVAGVVVSPQQLTTSEPAGTTAFSITLTSEPTATVTVQLQSGDSGECAVPATVSLDASTWNKGISVPVQALDDRIDDADQSCVVATDVTSADGDYDGISAADVDVTVQDDGDTAAIIVSTEAVTVSEPIGTSSFTITLNSEPVAPVTITLQASDSSECSADSVTLDATNWENGVTVLARATDDDVDDGTQLCVLQTSAVSDDPLYNAMAVADVTATVEDEDVAGMLQSTTVVTTTEPDGIAAYTISLTSEPVATVTVALTSDDTTACTVPASVALDATNWRDGVAIPVMAVDDYHIDGTQHCTVSNSVTSSDPLYAVMTLNPVNATILDEDAAGVVLASADESMSELDGSTVVTVALTSEPTANVTVTLTSIDTTECTISGGATTESVTLTPTQWQQGIAVTATAVRDDLDDGSQRCIITATAASDDTDYQDVAADPFAIMVTDGNQSAMEVSFTASKAIAEIGDVITYTYRVTNTGDVALTLQGADDMLGAVPFDQGTIGPQVSAVAVLTKVATESDLPGPLVNNATITGRSPSGKILTENRSVTVAVAANPQLIVDVQRLGPPIVIPGTVVTYEVAITNVGSISAKVTEIVGAPAESTQAAGVTAGLCSTPLTIAAGATHRCLLTWSATTGNTDTVDFVISVTAEGLLDFANTTSDSATIVVSGPTSTAGKRLFIPIVSR